MESSCKSISQYGHYCPLLYRLVPDIVCLPVVRETYLDLIFRSAGHRCCRIQSPSSGVCCCSLGTTFHQASTAATHLGNAHSTPTDGVKPYQNLVPRLRRLWRSRAKPLYKHKSGGVSLGLITSFPIRIRLRTVLRELGVSAQELRSSPSPYITVCLLPSRSQDATRLSPGHWALRLVPEGWRARNWTASCLYWLE